MLPLAGLGLPKNILTGLESVLNRPHVIFLVCGPTGSGKTTTLYAALQRLDTDRLNILTIEDPVEYHLPNIGQIQIKPKIGLTFAAGLRHILRLDPDVIFLGEIRDLESAEIAIRASMTGHMVFATLHTNDAAGAPIRLIDMGIAPYLLSSALRGVMAQRLVRRLCGVCKKEVSSSVPIPGISEEIRSKLAGSGMYLPVGCSGCLEGYKGRSGIFEFLTITREVQDYLRSSSATSNGLLEIAKGQGMQTLLEHGVEEVVKGVTSVQELMRAVGAIDYA